MKKVCALFGHSMFVECRLKLEFLISTLENLIKSGVQSFLVGTHGEFDKLSLHACCYLKDTYPNIKIYKVCSNINSLIKNKNYNKKVDVISYEIEKFHYKQRITKSNEIMIDSADVIVCYVDESACNSGALKTFKYSKKKNKEIINLYNFIN